MKPATEKIYELLWKIQQEYKGIVPKEDIDSINNVLLNTIKKIQHEEKEQLENQEG
jgi:predicted AlkP superfamily phosphohydrolase/phosphomutase